MRHPRRLDYLRALGVQVWVPRGSDRGREDVDVSPPRNAVVAAPVAAPVAATVAAPLPDVVVTVRERPPPPIDVPQDWDGLRAMVKDCTRCRLCETRTQTVFGVGPSEATLMIVGEGPGADEDAQGEPFVGRAGKLLDEMLAAIGRSRRENTFIANVVKCRPPGNRDPQADEAEACRPYLEQQVRLLKPRLIVALGKVAANRLLATSDQPLSKMRGPMHHYGPDRTPLFITYHPAYLLRSPREKAKSWEDLKKVWRFLQQEAPV
ncbi:MAG: uracil-DNA glycosylase [Panacagrimonas sp.]|jgi:DNA polymerase|nr:uracil-DNA glycosylase [Panacagrimonas sp.]MCC2657426.1 uracil-DNA glycosylase [Panacagrimonas sp.]